ncbi:MAG: F0F1 ATP synthase subunit A [Bulleidia sp.]|nr:F0F1 ATP synthase subunit A [Bulleidia sp.]
MTIQKEVWVILLLTILIGVAFVRFGKKIDAMDPMAKPEGKIVPVLLGVSYVHNTVKENCGEKVADKFTPYVIVLWLFIFLSNIISIFGLPSPTGTLSVTLTLSLVTWTLIQITEFKYGGVKAYFHSFLEPIPVMLPMNIIGKFSMIISLSFRLFGNILCGGILMSLIYSAIGLLSNKLIGLVAGPGTYFNFLAPVIAPVFHAYFDLFSGFIQTLVFTTLTVVLVGNDIPEEYKKGN